MKHPNEVSLMNSSSSLKTLGFGLYVSLILALALIWPYYLPNVIGEARPERVRSSGSAKASVEAKIDRGDYYFWMLRDPEQNQIPNGIRELELEHARVYSVYKTLADPQVEWVARGPMNIGGRTRALALDVRNPRVVLAGGVSGGLWKSTDGGNTWSLRNTPDQNLSITWIAQDTRPGHQDVWYYAGGEYIGGSARDRGGRASFYGSGIYKSTDNGNTWQVLPSTVIKSPVAFDSPFDFVSKIAVSPTTGTVFIASNALGIYRSTDGGVSFQDGSALASGLVLGNVNEHFYNDVIVLPNGTVVAAMSLTTTDTPPLAGIYRSKQDGAPGTWENITPNGFPERHGRSVLAMSSSEPHWVYVLTHELLEGSNFRMTLFRFNVETGKSENLTGFVPNFGGAVGNFEPQGGYNMVLAVKPDNPRVILLGGTNLYRTLDGFSSALNNKDLHWIGGYNTANNVSRYPNHHPDQHVIFFEPGNPNRVWSGHDGGVSVTDNIESPTITWTDRNRGYVTTQFYTISLFNAVGDTRVLGGTQDNGSLFFSDTKDAVDVTTGDGSYAYLGEQFAYGATQNGKTYRLRYDANGDIVRNSRTSIQPKGTDGQLFIHPFAVDPNDENVMYYPQRNTLWRNTKLGTMTGHVGGFDGSSDGWSQLQLNISSNLTITALEASIQPEHIVYLGASQRSNTTPALTPMVYRMENAVTATTATPIPLPASLVTAGSYIHDIAINPSDADEILIVISNYNVNRLFHSTDGGNTYTVVDGNLGNVGNLPGPSVRSAQLLPITDGTFAIVATSTGVYSTDRLNGSKTVWAKEGAALMGNLVVERLAARVNDAQIAAATHGRGIFTGKLKLPVVPFKLPETFALYPNYPNPFNPETIIAFDLSQRAKVTLRVYDVLGRPVATLLNNQELRPRKHRVRFQAEDLPSGVYLYRLEVVQLEDKLLINRTGKMTLLR